MSKREESQGLSTTESAAGGRWDVIVVGARIAGAATALQLARRGHKVLLIDRNRFPSDHLSTHVIQLSGLKVLSELGLLKGVAATGAPPITKFKLQAGPFTLTGRPVPAGPITDTLCVRRTKLDQVLVDAARRSGAEVREHFSFLDVLADDAGVKGIRARSVEGRELLERARIVVGADGKRSHVARAVGAGTYETIPARTCIFYSYFEDVDVDRHEGQLYLLDRRTLAVFPTNDGQTMVGLQAPRGDFESIRHDVEASFWEAATDVPRLAERLREGKRVEQFRGTPDLDAFFRVPAGPGWAVVGDAGCHKDPITAQGISDALRDSVFLTDALHDHLMGTRSWEEAGADYRRRRDQAEMARYHWTAQTALLDRPPAPETLALFKALASDRSAVGRFFGVFAGTVAVEEFFSQQSMSRLLGVVAA
ncbi:MAG: NAD(P)/FAD-dependent oxidoreductase [Actinomycetota bacterium]|nr:NAD(P)/FAD-dependent oxidoreductase [Actinomycetota bacterium]